MLNENLSRINQQSQYLYSSTTLKQCFREMIDRYEYAYFVTITFKVTLIDSEAVRCLNILLHYVNRSYFSRAYQDKGKFLQGFVAYEQHSTGNLHFHILLRKDVDYSRSDGKTIEDIFKEKSRKVKKERIHPNNGKSNTYKIFGPQSIDVREVTSNNINGYTMKDGYQYQYDNIEPLTKDGVEFANL